MKIGFHTIAWIIISIVQAVFIYNVCVDQINIIKKDEYTRGFYNCLAIVVERSKSEEYNVLPEWNECERSFEMKEDLYNDWKISYLYHDIKSSK